jgi:hypothetical protein
MPPPIIVFTYRLVLGIEENRETIKSESKQLVQALRKHLKYQKYALILTRWKEREGDVSD